MTGYSLVTAAVLDDAVCLDGTPGLYYHRPGTGTGATKWYGGVGLTCGVGPAGGREGERQGEREPER